MVKKLFKPIEDSNKEGAFHRSNIFVLSKNKVVCTIDQNAVFISEENYIFKKHNGKGITFQLKKKKLQVSSGAIAKLKDVEKSLKSKCLTRT